MPDDNVIRFPRKDGDKKGPAETPFTLRDYPDVPYRTRCPTCKHPLWEKDEEGYACWQPVSIPRACHGTSWWKRTFENGCRAQGVHLHQRCYLCKDEWICLPPKSAR